jgi:hypothetical protein
MMLYETCCVFFLLSSLLYPQAFQRYPQRPRFSGSSYWICLNVPQRDDDVVLASRVTAFPSLPLLLTLALCPLAREGHCGTVYELRDGVEHKSAITISR